MSAVDTPGGAVPAASEDRINVRNYVMFGAMAFGLFMVILDIQIVSASLADIQAGLSASSDELPWIQTSYLIAKVIAVPVSGFLLRAFSTRYTFVFSAVGFTIMSVMCATATTMNEMILWRSLQGLLGGPMVPAVFATAFTIFPRSQQPMVAALLALVATLGPTLGPTIGGYLTELYSWHWAFLANVIPGIAVAATAWFLIDFDKPNLKLLEKFDWTGLFALALFLGSLQFVLQEGQRREWFDSSLIIIGIFVSVLGGLVFFWRAFTSEEPIVDLRPFLNRNFAAGCTVGVALGVGMHGLIYLYPVYLAGIRDYSPLMIGKAMFVTGMAQFVTAPIAARLAVWVDLRVIVAIGLVGFGLGTLDASYLTREWDYAELFVPQILRGASLTMCMAALNQITFGRLLPDQIKAGSSLYALIRNLAGAIGLALINSGMAARLDLHAARLRESVSWGSYEAEEALQRMAERLSGLGSNAEMGALKSLAIMVHKEASVMAFADVFLVLTVLFFAMVFLLPIVERPQPPAARRGGR